MAGSMRHALSGRLDIGQLVLEAQQRWLRPAEICEILQNYKKFEISPEPPHLPASGSLFIFDKKVLRYFRKDGHSWRKKKDGKTIREAHEKLKAGSIDVLHCYYAHGQDDENFQRRIYWLLEEDLSHIVLVHYREVKVNRGYSNRSQEVAEASPNIQEFQEDIQNFGTENSASVSFESFDQHHCMLLPEKTGMVFRESAQALEFEDVESGELAYDHHKQLDWEDSVKTLTFGGKFAPSIHSSVITSEPNSTKIIATQGSELMGKLLRNRFPQNGAHQTQNQMQAQPQDLEEQLLNSQCKEDFMSYKQTNLSIEHNSNDFSTTKHLMNNSSKDEVLKKNDSFGRWMSKELEDVSESSAASSALCWQTLDSESQFEDDSISSQYMLGPSLSEDQLFSIIDFSPNWVYAGSQSKVLITGKFLKCLQDVGNVKWSCMFGELEVPVEVIADGILCCLTPRLGAGRVSFCITCSNRVACSEVREFEYRDKLPQRKAEADEGYDIRSDILNMRFDRMLSTAQEIPIVDYSNELHCLRSKINSLIREDDDDQAESLSVTSKESFSVGEMKDRLAESMLKKKLYSWLLHKASEGGKGSSVLDEDGQGVLHFAAALGYNWAFSPTIEAGISINFRDIHGWAALHWAAFCGRERTIAYLVSLGAAPGALTDPNLKYPMGRTAADLASSKGHKGIAGYLAESALSAHLSSLSLKDGPNPGQVALEHAATQSSDGEYPSLKDSLAAVCNATQAAARIHQVFRVQSFQRKQIEEYRDIVGGISDEDALSMLALKTHKSDRLDEPVQAAAIRIQNKFRSWKGRKEFLMIRQHIVKIQAHVRGHQARKKSFVWSVFIVEKVILRWRRKRGGLRIKPEPSSEDHSIQEGTSTKDDDYNFLKEGRKQTEGRVQKALARVKSMVQYPEARDQYHRMLTIAQEAEELKVLGIQDSSNSEEPGHMDSDLIDLDMLLDDKTFMLE